MGEAGDQKEIEFEVSEFRSGEPERRAVGIRVLAVELSVVEELP